MGQRECRFVTLNVIMPAPLVTGVIEVDVTVPDKAAQTQSQV